METIVFGGGCFWCTEAVFLMLKGVQSVEPGYTGGETEHPTYEQICTGKTGHAEVIKIVYDPAVIAVRDLLTVFFATHDPSQLNRQGNDVGTQYRSAVFYTTEGQREEVQKIIQEINNEPGSPVEPGMTNAGEWILNQVQDDTIQKGGEENQKVVTEVTPLGVFWPAENYHKDYFAKNPEQGYCQIVINPKVAKVQERFAELLRVKSSSSP